MEVKYILATKSSYSYDPRGRRRKPNNPTVYSGIAPRFDRGYTMHYYASTERIAAQVDKGNKIQHTKPLPSGLTGSPLVVGKMNKSLKKTNIK